MKYTPTIEEYEENIKYLLDKTDKAVRVRYKYTEENLLESLCLNYLQLLEQAGRMKPDGE